LTLKLLTKLPLFTLFLPIITISFVGNLLKMVSALPKKSTNTSLASILFNYLPKVLAASSLKPIKSSNVPGNPPTFPLLSKHLPGD